MPANRSLLETKFEATREGWSASISTPARSAYGAQTGEGGLRAQTTRSNCFSNLSLPFSQPVKSAARRERMVRRQAVRPAVEQVAVQRNDDPESPGSIQSFDSGGSPRAPVARRARTTNSNCSSNLSLSFSHPVKSAARRDLI